MKQFRCKAIIFDLDGVLIDSSAVAKRQWRRWIIEHDLDPDRAPHVMHGQRLVEIVRHVAPHLDAEAEAARLAAWEATDTDGLREIEGAADLVRSLPRDAWAVVTSGNLSTALTRLAYADLPVPGVLITADNVARGKPHPEPYLLAAQRLGIVPADCIVIEDAPAGVHAACAAGMRVVALTTTHGSDALEKADAIATRLLDIDITTAHPETGEETVSTGILLLATVYKPMLSDT
jgi:sugar-phosphatase